MVDHRRLSYWRSSAAVFSGRAARTNPIEKASYNNLMTDWAKIAKASVPEIPDEQMERIGPVLEALERAFRVAVETLPHPVESALVFRAEEQAE